MKKLWIAVPVSLAVLVPAILLATRSGHSGAAPPSPTSTRPRPTVAAPQPTGPYQQAIDAAYQHGLRVWLESDLVKRWLAGPAEFRAGVAQLGALATRPGVVGIKIADEIGYQDGLDTPAQIQSFLTDSATALHAAAPGMLLLVDMIVPELGCLPQYTPAKAGARDCAARQRDKYPQLMLGRVDEYLRAHLIDVLDLSTNLQTAATYANWGVDPATAQRAAWQEVQRRDWGRYVRLQGRKALAHPGYYAATENETQAALTTFLDIPRSMGAVAVDVWTWRQLYKGQLYRVLDPGLKDNALWGGLLARRAQGARLFTHLSPQSLERGLQDDLAVLAQVFTDLFVAAGTG